MAVLGGYSKGWDLVRHVRGGREGGCTTRRKKTAAKRRLRRVKSVAEMLAEYNPYLEALVDATMERWRPPPPGYVSTPRQPMPSVDELQERIKVAFHSSYFT